MAQMETVSQHVLQASSANCIAITHHVSPKSTPFHPHPGSRIPGASRFAAAPGWPTGHGTSGKLRGERTPLLRRMLCAQEFARNTPACVLRY